MTSPGGTHEKHISTKSSLNSLQAQLTKFKEIYKDQNNILEQLIVESNLRKSSTQNRQNEAAITFKKLKLPLSKPLTPDHK